MLTEPKILGNFALLERIGKGGMGAVFKARQLSMDRVVAVKVLPQGLAQQPTFIERFMREARASAKLNHPNIVRGIDVGCANGLYYFAMEYVQGVSAKTLIKPGGESEATVLAIAKGMADALAHAHDQGILHRDIKPDNILIDGDGHPKLCDLGLARQTEQTEEEMSLTQAGSAMGTPLYISPEQARGQADLDPRTDLYSLGASMYHLLVGRPMFSGGSAVAIMTQHVTAKAPSPAELGVTLSRGTLAILAKLLAKDRADRYQSAAQLSEDIGRVQKGGLPQHAALPAVKWPFTGSPAALAPVRRSSPTVPGLPHERPRAGAHARPPARRGQGLLWVGVGIVLAAGVAAAVALRGGHGPGGAAPASAPSAAVPETTRAPDPVVPTQDALAQQLLTAADDALQRQPGDLDGAIAAYRKVLAEAGGSPLAARAKDALGPLEARRAALTALIQRCSERASTLAASDRFDQAIAVWTQAQREQGPALAPAATTAITALQQAADARITALLAPVTAAIAAGRWADGQAALAAAAAVAYAPAQGRLADLRHRLDAGRAQAERDAQAEALSQADTAFRPVAAAFVTATLRDEVAAARKIAADAQLVPALAPVAPRLQAMAALCDALARIDAQPRAAILAQRDGRRHHYRLTSGEVSGIVIGANEREFTLAGFSDDASSQMQVAYARLAPEELRRLRAGFHAGTPAEHLALAIKELADRDAEAARKDIAQAQQDPLTAAFQARLDVQLMGAEEAAAKEAWEAIQRDADGHLSPDRSRHVLDEISAFMAAHGRTRYAASIAPALQALQDHVRFAERSLVLELPHGITLQTLLVTPGTFLMGSPPTEPNRLDDEHQHQVTLTRPYYLGRCPVTQAQWVAVMGANPSTNLGPDLPVEGVSWLAAMAFCDRLSTVTGHRVRLPTEAEWEYACRAGTKTAYPFGDDPTPLGDFAWYSDNTEGGNAPGLQGMLAHRTCPVGQKRANPWGFCDMLGNISQWCADVLGPYPDDACTDPQGPPEGHKHVIRGGSVTLAAKDCRSSARHGYDDFRVSSHLGRFGLRICVEAPGSGPSR